MFTNLNNGFMAEALNREHHAELLRDAEVQRLLREIKPERRFLSRINLRELPLLIRRFATLW